MAILNAIWTFFATYILQKAPYMIGFLVLIGYLLKKEKWYNTLGGTLKAIIGMLILQITYAPMIGALISVLFFALCHGILSPFCQKFYTYCIISIVSRH